MKKGKLFLIPVPLGDDALHTLPGYLTETIHSLQYFIVENARTARRFIKSTGIERPISELIIAELNKKTPDEEKPALLQPLREGNDAGLMSEAGCPGVADPGATLVRLAYLENIEVVPLVGPSSILLALMASGMNGQSFCFHGYLSANRSNLQSDLKKLENFSVKGRQTQIFMETPYRNNAVLETAFKVLLPDTLFCIAVDLTLPTQWIFTTTIREWKKKLLPDIHKRPAIFLLLA